MKVLSEDELSAVSGGVVGVLTASALGHGVAALYEEARTAAATEAAIQAAEDQYDAKAPLVETIST